MENLFRLIRFMYLFINSWHDYVEHFGKLKGSSVRQSFIFLQSIHQSGVLSTIIKKRQESSLSWTKSWRQKNFQQSDWLVRGY